MPKKSYMDKSNILSEHYFKASNRLHEGFLKTISNFVKNIPSFGKDKKEAMKRLTVHVNNLNKSIEKMETEAAKWLPDDYPPLPRFSPSDFIK
jgi:hypothetical protein|tara:strand:+ start:1535 stop:1813 length:279 start_codon:yes stop_codon:yes gene_type:complete